MFCFCFVGKAPNMAAYLLVFCQMKNSWRNAYPPPIHMLNFQHRSHVICWTWGMCLGWLSATTTPDQDENTRILIFPVTSQHHSFRLVSPQSACGAAASRRLHERRHRLLPHRHGYQCRTGSVDRRTIYFLGSRSQDKKAQWGRGARGRGSYGETA